MLCFGKRIQKRSLSTPEQGKNNLSLKTWLKIRTITGSYKKTCVSNSQTVNISYFQSSHHFVLKLKKNFVTKVNPKCLFFNQLPLYKIRKVVIEGYGEILGNPWVKVLFLLLLQKKIPIL